MQHGNHLKQMLIIAVVLLAGLVVVGVPAGSALLAAALLACPIGMAAMMFFMMRGTHDHEAGNDHTTHDEHNSAQQPARMPADPLG